MNCPKCNKEVGPGVKFCGSCGSSLVSKCLVCGASSSLSDVYCPECGSDKLNSQNGLPLARALAWREQFKMMGWNDVTIDTIKLHFPKMSWKANSYDVEKAQQYLQTWHELLKANSIPDDPFNKSEPWIFATFFRLIGVPDWTINDFRVNIPNTGDINKRDLSGMSKNSSDWKFLLTTRCRLVYCNPLKQELFQWPYSDMCQGQVNAKGDVNLTTDKGDTIYFHVWTKGPRLIDRAVAVSSADSQRQGQYLIAQANVASAKSSQMEFMLIVQDFCREIIAVGATALH